jgi:hypothetical protein
VVHLDGSIADIEYNLRRYEEMMNYYFDLCTEFRGKDKETARTERLNARCGVSNELALPPLDTDKSEADLRLEKTTCWQKSVERTSY